MQRFTNSFAVLVLACAAAPAVRADEVPLDKVPAAVTKAQKERFPKAEVVKVERDTDAGVTSYEFTLKAEGRRVEVEFTPEGKFLKSTEELNEADVPAAVKEGLRKNHPTARIRDAEKVTTGGGAKAAVVYKLDVRVGRVDRDIVIDAAGKLVSDRID